MTNPQLIIAIPEEYALLLTLMFVMLWSGFAIGYLVKSQGWTGKRIAVLLVGAIVAFVFLAWVLPVRIPPTPEPTPTPLPTCAPLPTYTPYPTPQATWTPMPTCTRPPTCVPTRTPTMTPTSTVTPYPSRTPVMCERCDPNAGEARPGWWCRYCSKVATDVWLPTTNPEGWCQLCESIF